MRQREDMIFVQVAAGVAELAEFAGKSQAILRAVHFDEENRTLFAKQPLGALKNGYFRAFDIAFEEVWSGMQQNKFIERDGFDGDGVGGGCVTGRNVTEAAIRRSSAIGAHKGNRGWLRPNRFFFDANVGELVVGNIFAKARGNFGVSFERKDTAARADESCGEERERSDIGAKIVKGHPRAEVLDKGLLDGRLPIAFKSAMACAHVNAEPQASSRTVLNLNPS